MKTTVKMFGLMTMVLLVISLGFVSCNNDDDSPAEHDIFVGKYTGDISYTHGEDHTATNDGSVEVVKVGNNYNFLFSNQIPNITGVEFESDGETLINVGNTASQYIRVTAHSLQILYTDGDDEVWTADCTR